MVVANKAKSVTKKVKLFKNGASQAVRLPADFRFEGSEIYATRDPETGEVLLSSSDPELKKGPWELFFEALEQVDPDDPEVRNFMVERPLNIQHEWRSALDIDDPDVESKRSR